MIFPLSHEHTTVRRLPWVTFSIMGLCLLAHVLTLTAGGDVSERLAQQFGEAIEYYQSHPYLEVDPRLDRLLFQGMREEEVEALKEMVKEFGAESPASSTVLAEEQQRLDTLVDEAFNTRGELPWYRWGLIPAEKTLHGVITYQFMHGGWLHLIFNMFFLYLAGPFIEDVWGRPLFASFYLASGAISGLLFAAHYPELDGPLVGASGAVAGVMGAFLIRYWSTKIQFLYVFFPLFVGTFTAPAWIMLLLWLARELLFAQAMDVIGPAGGGGVAHWAHVWGFACGVASAVAIKHFDVERRYIDTAIEGKITLYDNSVLDDILESYRRGEVEASLERLAHEVQANPDNVDVVTAYWNLARERGTASAVAAAVAGSVKRAARRGSLASFDPVFVELAEHTERPFDPVTALRMAEYLIAEGRQSEALVLIESVAGGVTAADPPGLLVKLALTAAELGSDTASHLAAVALRHPEVPDERRAELVGLAPAAPAVPGPAPESPETDQGGTVETTTGPTLKVMTAVPRRLADGTLTFKAGGQRRSIGLRAAAAVAAAVIHPPEARRSIVVDVLLDAPIAGRVRVLRFSSSTFDPCSLMGGDRPLDAIHRFIVTLLDGAAPVVALPDEASLRRGSYAEFESVEAYESAVLTSAGS